MENSNYNSTSWVGYSFDEMQYKRILALTRKELQQEKLFHSLNSIITEDASPKGVAGSITKTLFGKLTILDYMMLGIKLSRHLGKIWKFFKR